MSNSAFIFILLANCNGTVREEILPSDLRWYIKTTHVAILSRCNTFYMSAVMLQSLDDLSQRVRLNLQQCVTRLKVQSWPRLYRWIHRSVTFCETSWPRGLSSWWDADKCQSGGTWSRSPFSSSCKFAAGLPQNSSLLALRCSSELPSWCCSRCWPELKKIRTQWKTVQNEICWHTAWGCQRTCTTEQELYMCYKNSSTRN